MLFFLKWHVEKLFHRAALSNKPCWTELAWETNWDIKQSKSGSHYVPDHLYLQERNETKSINFFERYELQFLYILPKLNCAWCIKKAGYCTIKKTSIEPFFAYDFQTRLFPQIHSWECYIHCFQYNRAAAEFKLFNQVPFACKEGTTNERPAWGLRFSFHLEKM